VTLVLQEILTTRRGSYDTSVTRRVVSSSYYTSVTRRVVGSSYNTSVTRRVESSSYSTSELLTTRRVTLML
jgi:hypothetical protein